MRAPPQVSDGAAFPRRLPALAVVVGESELGPLSETDSEGKTRGEREDPLQPGAAVKADTGTRNE